MEGEGELSEWLKQTGREVARAAGNELKSVAIKNTRKRKATQDKSFGLPVNKHHINAMRHISRRDMPPRTSEEAEDMASRRGSTAAEMMSSCAWHSCANRCRRGVAVGGT
jgi:hypothetical protein